MKTYTKNIIGIAGEVFIKKHCKLNNIDYREATEQENIMKGIDCYINDIPTDIKNTDRIFFLQLNDEGVFFTRHPFRIESEAEYYCFVNVNSKAEGKFKEHVKISEKIIENYFESPENYIIFRKRLEEINKKSYKFFGLTIEQSMYNIKKELSSHLSNGYISYTKEETTQLYSFELKRKKEITKESISNKLISSNRQVEIIVI